MSSQSKKVPTSVNHGQYKIGQRIGAGCFGEVYLGRSADDKTAVAIKFEDASVQSPQLEKEADMLTKLRSPALPQGFVEMYHFGIEANWNCLVMEALEKSLEDRVQMCGGKFTPKTACLVADQILMRIEYLHSKGLIHRDIKPENFMWGEGRKQHHLYLIDFGLSKEYWRKRHIPPADKLNLTGTARYASLNAHRGLEQSRRDDLEAIGHMLMYFLRAVLPWSGLEAKSKKEKYAKIHDKKASTPLDELCAGYPVAFKTFLEYTRGLEFKDRPDYNMLRKLFADLKAELEKAEGKEIKVWHLQWLENSDPGELEPLLPYKNVQQPDDDKQEVAQRRGFCGCFGGSKVED